MKICILINPRSGGGLGAKLLEEFRRTPTYNGYDIHTVPLSFELKLDELRKYAAVIIAGGDGSIARCASLLLDHTTPIGILPLGTGNDLARELNTFAFIQPLPRDTLIDRVIQLAQLPIKEVSVWKVSWGELFQEHLAFINYLSFGFDAQVVNSFAEWRSRHKYVSTSLGALKNRCMYAKYCLQHSGYVLPSYSVNGISIKSGKTKSLLLSNVQSCMGLGRINAVSDCSDNILEMHTITSITNYLQMMGYRWLPSLVSPLTPSAAYSEIVLQFEQPVPFQVDGEGISKNASTQYRIAPLGKVRMFSHMCNTVR